MGGNKISTPYEGLFSIKDKVALVVGAAGGLAGETCLGLAQYGARLALADLDPEGLKEVSSMLQSKGIEPWCHVTDVSDETSVATLFDALEKTFGRLDIMINFAGIAVPSPIEAINTAEFQKIINVNLFGSFILAKYSLALMVAQGSGKIILVGSVSGQIGRPFSAHYSASKGGVHSMVRTLAVEMAKKNIQINSIAPVFTLTPMATSVVGNEEGRQRIVSTIPMGRLGLPSDLVGAMIFLVSSASDFVTGQTVFVDGGCTIS